VSRLDHLHWLLWAVVIVRPPSALIETTSGSPHDTVTAVMADAPGARTPATATGSGSIGAGDSHSP
jgi:hypothetical protein